MRCHWYKQAAFAIYIAAIIPAVVCWVWWDFLSVGAVRKMKLGTEPEHE